MKKCYCSKVEEIEITEEHMKLLQRAYVDWEDCEYGAPAIDCKRPYGNSDVEGDICEILGWGPGFDENLNSDIEDRCEEIHRQTQYALQIILRARSFDVLGSYRSCMCSDYEWVRV